MDLEHALTVVGVALVVATAPVEDGRVGAGVDVVDRPRDRRQPAAQERLAQRLGEERQIRERAEAAEALPEDAPAVDAELAADVLRVADDRVGPEVREVFRLLLRALPRQRPDWSRPAGAPLVEHQHAVLTQGAFQPGASRRRLGRSRRFASRPALEVHEQREVARARGITDELPGEDADRLACGRRVVERHGELVLEERQRRDAAPDRGHGLRRAWIGSVASHSSSGCSARQRAA